jgi:hypothetical protein
MSGTRRAALALYALTDADREQILGDLAASEQAALRGHLQELQELGFERASAPLLRPLAPARTPAAPASAAEVIDAAPAAALYAILQDEPLSLLKPLLAVRRWRWQAELLALFPAARRVALQAASTSTVAPALEQFLLRTLAQRLQAGSAMPLAAAPRAAWWQRVPAGWPWKR